MAQTARDTNVTKLPVLHAGAKGIVPQSFDECHRLAEVLSKSSMVPDAFRNKANDCCVAIMQGLELGMSPISALQSIAVVNGRPSLWGDGFLAVIRGSGLLEWCKETDDGKTATCIMKRRGEPDPVTRTFSAADAANAGLSGKGVWKSYPARMRQMRARGFCGRDLFPDVLRGVHLAEEAHDIPMRDVTPKPSAQQIEASGPSESAAPDEIREPGDEPHDPSTGELVGPVNHLTVIKLIDETNANVAELCRYFGRDKLSDLSTSDAERAIKMLVRKRDALMHEVASYAHGN